MTKAEIIDYLKQHGHVAFSTRDERIGAIRSATEAAVHMIQHAMDNELDAHIEKAIASSSIFRSWRAAMPNATPPPLFRYQKNYPKYDRAEVDAAITSANFHLPVGQKLFHGGVWPDPCCSLFKTDRPLSTTLLPSVALRNAEFKGKAHDVGEIQLMVLTVQSPNVKAFVFKNAGTRLSHEHEVLLPSGIRLMLRNKMFVRADYPAGLDGKVSKYVHGTVLEIDVE